MKKKILSFILLLFIIPLSLLIDTHATVTTHVLDTSVSTTHSIDVANLDLNQVTITYRGVDIFEKGYILDTSIDMFRTNLGPDVDVLMFQLYDSVLDLTASVRLNTDGSLTISQSIEPITIEIDDTYVPTTQRYFVSWTYLIMHDQQVTYFYDEGDTVDLIPTTKTAYVYDGWYEQYNEINVFRESFVIDRDLALYPIFVSPDLPVWDFDSSIERTDYSYHYFDDTDTVHTLTTIDTSKLTLYVNETLVYERGVQIDANYTITTTSHVLEITDNVNVETTTINLNGTFTWTTNITSLMFLISDVALNHYYVDTSTEYHGMPYLYKEDTDIYSEHDDIYVNSVSNSSLYNFVDFEDNRVQIPGATVTDWTAIHNDSSHMPNYVARQGAERDYLFVVFNTVGPMFNLYNKTHEGVTVNIFENTVTLSQLDQYYHSFETDNLAPYLNLELGKYYRVDIQELSTVSTFDSFDDTTNDLPEGLFYFINDYQRYVFNSVPTLPYDSSFVIKSTNDLDLRIIGHQIKIVDDYQYRLIFTEVVAHEIEYIEPFDLMDRSRSMLLSFDPNPTIEKMLDGGGFVDEYVEHEETATEPTVNLDEYDIVGYYDLTLDQWFDYNDPIIADHDVQPILVPKVDNVVVFDSQGGSYVDYQVLQDGQKAINPTPPTKSGYTFNGWYELDYYNLTDTIEDLNNQTLEYYFTDSSSYAQSFGMILPNEITDEILNGNYVQRVKKYTLQASDITTFNNTSKTNFDYIQIPYSVFNGSVALVNNYTAIYFEDKSPANGNTSFSNDETIFSTQFNVSLSGSLMHVGLPIGTYASLAEAQADLAGTVIYYQLATPIETPISLTQDELEYYYAMFQYNIQDNYDIQQYLTTVYDFTSIPTDDVYLVAKWIENAPGDISITYNTLGGSYVSPVSLTPGSLLTRPNDPYLEGYDFLGWYYDLDFTEYVRFDEHYITEDTMLYAKFDIPVEEVSPVAQAFMDYWIYVAIFAIAIGIITSRGLKGRKRSSKPWYMK